MDLAAPVVGQQVAADRQDPGLLRAALGVVGVPRADHALEDGAREVLGGRARDRVGEEGVDGADVRAVDPAQLVIVAPHGRGPASRARAGGRRSSPRRASPA